MRIEEVGLTEIQMPMKIAFRTSLGVTTERRILLLRLTTDRGEGVAECVAGEDAGYSYETVDTAWVALREMIVPAVIGRSIASPADLVGRLSHIQGHTMAKAALENAYWDAQSRAAGMPLWQFLGGVKERVPVGAVVGFQRSIDETLRQMERLSAEGYRRVKLKIKPGWDTQLVRAARDRHPEIELTVDANAAYALTDMRVFKELDGYGLDYVEQPLARDDLHGHAVLQSTLATPVCLDESIQSPPDASRALSADAGRVINVKIGRVGGLLAARQIHDIAQAFSVPVWCGGMLETGLGRAFNIALSTLPNFRKPGDTASSSRYWERDVVNEPIEAESGWMRVPDGPGTGVTVDWEYVRRLQTRVELLT